MKIKNILLGSLLLLGLSASAHDFTATVNGQRLCFEITNKSRKTVAVTYNGSIADKKPLEINGIVEIPSRVKHDNVVYDVKAIGQKAFANSDGLKGIIIPSGVESIGDFAFENCDSLKSVVFPGNPVTLGQGVFFNCPEISDITVGSDWKAIDLSMFRWSDRITSINIPAKIEKIQGVKKLVALETITVDPNNKKFASDKGMLYSKDGTTLFACPRAYKGNVKVKDGTVKVTEGALIDCVGVTVIDLPETLRSMSFRETSRMKELGTIIIRSETPMITGYFAGDGKFLFQLANPKTVLVIPSPAKSKYYAALATAAGEYSVMPDSVPYMVTVSELPTIKNFKEEKNLAKY